MMAILREVLVRVAGLLVIILLILEKTPIKGELKRKQVKKGKD